MQEIYEIVPSHEFTKFSHIIVANPTLSASFHPNQSQFSVLNKFSIVPCEI